MADLMTAGLIDAHAAVALWRSSTHVLIFDPFGLCLQN